MRKSVRGGVLLGCLVALVLGGTARADVVRSAENGFEIRIEATVDASPQAVYDQFLRVGEWWNEEHTWFGKASGLSIDPRAGGCFCERDGENEVLHMIVSFVRPGHALHMIGGLGPLQGLGLYGAMSWSFEPVGAQTKIVHIYRVTGYYPDGLQALAPVVDGVQKVQVAGLAARFD